MNIEREIVYEKEMMNICYVTMFVL